LFGHGSKSVTPRPVTFARESIAVMGAVADLHQLRHWPRELIEVETENYVFDFAGYALATDGPERMIVAGEAKRSPDELGRWLPMLVDCLAMPKHDEAAHPSSPARNAHRKAHGLRLARPDFIWLVAIGERRCLQIRYEIDRVVLADVGTIPPDYLAYELAEAQAPR